MNEARDVEMTKEDEKRKKNWIRRKPKLIEAKTCIIKMRCMRRR